MPIHGEIRFRIKGIKIPGEVDWKIPHWNWNGHNQKIEDCEIFDA